MTQQCEVSFNQRTKKYECKTPSWFAGMGYYTLATYVAHKFEMELWIKYSMKSSSSKGVVQSTPLTTHPRYHLHKFWQSLPVSERKRLILSRFKTMMESLFLADTKVQNSTFSAYQQALEVLLNFMGIHSADQQLVFPFVFCG